MIKRFNDYDKTKAYSDFPTLPKGGYVCKVMGAAIENNGNGDYIKISFDIAEGEYAGFYATDYRSQQTEDKKWRGNYLLNIPLSAACSISASTRPGRATTHGRPTSRRLPRSRRSRPATLRSRQTGRRRTRPSLPPPTPKVSWMSRPEQRKRACRSDGHLRTETGA